MLLWLAVTGLVMLGLGVAVRAFRSALNEAGAASGSVKATIAERAGMFFAAHHIPVDDSAVDNNQFLSGFRFVPRLGRDVAIHLPITDAELFIRQENLWMRERSRVVLDQNLISGFQELRRKLVREYFGGRPSNVSRHESEISAGRDQFHGEVQKSSLSVYQGSGVSGCGTGALLCGVRRRLGQSHSLSHVMRLNNHRKGLEDGDYGQDTSEPGDPLIARRFLTFLGAGIGGYCCSLWGLAQFSRGRRCLGILVISGSILCFAAADLLFVATGFSWSWGWGW